MFESRHPQDPGWAYVPVRRVAAYVERSLQQGLDWIVFEPNAEPTWTVVRQQVEEFLTTLWQQGRLAGTKPEDAFFVRVDRTTMTQDDLDNGRLVVEVGIAPLKPAEFVVFRIGAWTGGTDPGTDP